MAMLQPYSAAYGYPQPQAGRPLQSQIARAGAPGAQQPQALGGYNPNYNPTTQNYGTGMNSLGGGMYGVNPNSAINAFMAGMAPAQWQAQRNAMQGAAASGLSGGPLQDVLNAANSQFLASMDPTIAQMILQSSMFNAGQANQGTLQSQALQAEQQLQNQLIQAQQQMANQQATMSGIGSLLGGLGSIFGI